MTRTGQRAVVPVLPGTVDQLRGASRLAVFGSVLDKHRDPRGRFATPRDVRGRLRLPLDVRCVAIAATRTPSPGGRRYASGGVVPVGSALGRHAKPELTLAFDDTWLGFGMGHVEVLERPETYGVLRRWLSPSGGVSFKAGRNPRARAAASGHRRRRGPRRC